MDYWLAEKSGNFYLKIVRWLDNRKVQFELTTSEMQATGGRLLSTGECRARARGIGIFQHTALIAFDSFEVAKAVYDSDPYQSTLIALADRAVRDVRIF